ncbi:MAG: ribonuclease R [Cytophagales bacterium]
MSKHKKNRSSSKSTSNKANTQSPPLREKILNLLDLAGQSLSIKSIYNELKANRHPEKEKIADEVLNLLEDGLIKVDENQNYSLNFQPMEELFGTVDMVNPRFGYVICEGREQDILVDNRQMNGALDGDKVKVLIYARKKKRDKHPEGEVVEIIERKRDKFVGKIQISPRFAFVVADSKKMHYDIFVHSSQTKGAQNGQKVLVKITKWPENGKSPEGVVEEVLGMSGDNDVEMHSIMLEYGLPEEFPDEVQKEAESLNTHISEDEVKRRRDFRGTTTFTIDPEDAKDFDDALSLRKLDNGNYEIGVHIADVSHYVLPNTLLDKEAFRRATSVYLVDRVVPMLPEKLSNELCSLRPNEDKLTFSAVFEMDANGKIYSEWFGKTVIHSVRRFTYEEAQERIESKEGDLSEEINILNDLAHKLRIDRIRHGSISFETVEVKFKLDPNGKPLYVFQKIRKDAHKMIEDFMLLANKKVAEFVHDLIKGNDRLTMVYRVHDRPDPDKIEALAVFARKFGHQFNSEEEDKIAQTLNKLAEDTEGKPEQNVIQNLAIRAMAKAKYTTQAMGHFGLAFKHYSHFTSPIRRYTDLLAHRLLQQYLQSPVSANKSEYEEKCKHSSEREKLAAEAERASIKYKQVEFMQSMEDRAFEGIVSGVTDWGLFVEIVETKCEGLVRMADMNDDFYDFDPKNLKLIGRRKGKTFTFGDRVYVRVKATDLDKRTIDLEFVKDV